MQAAVEQRIKDVAAAMESANQEQVGGLAEEMMRLLEQSLAFRLKHQADTSD